MSIRRCETALRKAEKQLAQAEYQRDICAGVCVSVAAHLRHEQQRYRDAINKADAAQARVTTCVYRLAEAEREAK